MLPVYNGGATLAMAISSIRAQTLEDWELLILDDGSVDHSVELAAAWASVDDRIRIFSDIRHVGLTDRLNQGSGYARGQFIARMDADDVAYPSRLAMQLSVLRRRPTVDLVGSSMLIFGSNGTARGKRLAPAEHHAIARRPWAGFRVFHPTWMGRTDWFRRHPYPRAERAEDQLLLFRSYRHSRFANLPAILLGYREPKLPLRNALTGRSSLAQAVARDLWREGSYLRASLPVISHGLRGVLDVTAAALRADSYLLPHRLAKVGAQDVAAWEDVWRATTHGAQVRPR